jgi:hypothetical protein
MSQADKIEARAVQDNVIIGEAIDEFIQDKRLWFRDLHKQHATDLRDIAEEKGNEFLPGTAKFIGAGLIPVQALPEDEIERKLLKEKSLANETRMQDEADARGSDYESPGSESEEDQWDAETFLTTYTNTDNHPGVIKFNPKVKVNKKAQIQLHSQFKVPVDGLNGLIPTAEEIAFKKERKEKDMTKAYEEVSDDSIEEDDDEKDVGD